MTDTGRPPRLLAAALAAARNGWPVFPLRPGSKRPAISGWPQAATCDPEQLAGWWRAAPCNIGIACGPAGLLVVDLDDAPSTCDGVDALAAGVATYTVCTPCGEHRYFTVDADRPGRCTAGVLAPRVDTRAVGGYVVAAGSVRSIDGRRRYYRTASAPGVRPAPAPASLLDALEPVSASALHAGRPGGSNGGMVSLSGYVRAAIAGETARVREAAPGTRNTALFTAAVHLGQLVAGGLFDEPEVSSQLRDACTAHLGIDGFTAEEADRAISNGLRYGLRRPRPRMPRLI